MMDKQRIISTSEYWEENVHQLHKNGGQGEKLLRNSYLTYVAVNYVKSG